MKALPLCCCMRSGGTTVVQADEPSATSAIVMVAQDLLTVKREGACALRALGDLLLMAVPPFPPRERSLPESLEP